jgi:uncharacterized membrane protein YdjX (TVP38/TMEM64 family)
MRLLWIFAGLTLALAIPFLLFGDVKLFTPEGAVAWLRGFGPWAWLAGMLLLVADLFLPVPGTAIMAALGFTYGPVLGGLVGAGGSFLSGAVAYGLCRALGRRAATRLASEADLAKGEALFQRWGAWLVVLSRWLPLFPEVLACMAGLTRMSPAIFFLALTCGSVPLGFTYAAIGHAGGEHPTLALLVSIGLPPLLWWVIHRFLFRDPAKLDSADR